MSLANTLRSIRDSNGLGVQELSERTHIGVAVIEDLENGRYDRISAAIYGSGFVKILATALGVDPAPLREQFLAEYQAWVDEKAAHAKPKPPPLKFSATRLSTRPEHPEPKDPAANPLLKKAPKPQAKPEAKKSEPVKAKPAAVASAAVPARSAPEVVAQARPAAPSAPAPEPVVDDAEKPQELFGALFENHDEPPAAQPEAAPVAAPASPVKAAEEVPPRQIPPKRTEKPVDETPSKKKEPVFFDEFAERRPFDYKEAAEKALSWAKSVLSLVPLKTVGVAAAILALAAGLCFLIAGGGGEDGEANVNHPGEVDVAISEPKAASEPEVVAEETPPAVPGESPAAVVEEAAPAAAEEVRPVVSFAGSALTDNLIPPPDCYAE